MASLVVPKLEVVYFSVRAKAEPVRMVLEYGGIPYVDHNVASFFDGKSWPEVKKAELTPYGQLPILVVDGQILAQQAAFLRYAASLVPGMIPDDKFQAAMCDSIFQATEELGTVNPLVNVYSGDKWKELKAEYLDNKLPSKIKYINRVVEASGGPFALGAAPYYCDFALHHVLCNTLELQPDVLAPYPALQKQYDAVSAIPSIKAFLEARPKTTGVGVKPMLEPNIPGARFVGAEQKAAGGNL